jgi:hypothetical protein
MLLVDTCTIPELIAGAVASVAGAFASTSVLAQRQSEMRPEVGLLRAIPGQIARVPMDLWLLASELGRALTGKRTNGRFHSIPFSAGTDTRANARRGAIELIGSLAPNTIVLGVDQHQTIVHQLRARHSERDPLREMSA